MNKFVTVLLAAALVICSTMSMTYAQTAPKIGVVDVVKAMNESEQGKKATAELTALIKSKEASLESKGRAIERLRAEIEKQGDVLSAEARKNKAEEYERLTRDYQRNAQDSQNEVNKRRAELEGRILQNIGNIVQSIGQEEKYTVIHERRSVLFYDPALDITDEVIKRLNASSGSASSSKSKNKK